MVFGKAQLVVRALGGAPETAGGKLCSEKCFKTFFNACKSPRSE